jgi:branched-subunit amino acid permease
MKIKKILIMIAIVILLSWIGFIFSAASCSRISHLSVPALSARYFQILNSLVHSVTFEFDASNAGNASRK